MNCEGPTVVSGSVRVEWGGVSERDLGVRLEDEGVDVREREQDVEVRLGRRLGRHLQQHLRVCVRTEGSKESQQPRNERENERRCWRGGLEKKRRKRQSESRLSSAHRHTHSTLISSLSELEPGAAEEPALKADAKGPAPPRGAEPAPAPAAPAPAPAPAPAAAPARSACGCA